VQTLSFTIVSRSASLASAGLDHKLVNAPFRFRPADWHEFFARRGFAVRTMRYVADEAVRGGRPPPLAWLSRLIRRLLRRFARTGTGVDAFRKGMGYACLQQRKLVSGTARCATPRRAPRHGSRS